MHSNQTDFVSVLISDCIQRGITDPEQIAEIIAGQYIVDDCKHDVLSIKHAITDSE